MTAGHALRPGKPLKRKLTPDVIQQGLTRLLVLPPAAGAALVSSSATRCGPRTSIRQTHTRLPRYARGKLGVVQMQHGCHMYPDSVATDQGDNPQWLYTVVFESRELWGPDADPTIKISIDAFEPYLDPA